MKKSNIMLGIVSLVLVLVVLAGCKQEPPVGPSTGQIEGTQELKKFSSVQEIKDFLKTASAERGYSGGYFGGMRAFGGMTEMAVTESAMAAPSAKVAAAGGAAEYSTTNIQVAGVDEADFVKNDDKYIYVIAQDKLVIADAFPAEDAKIVSETKLDGRPRNMFVNKDRLVVFTEENEEVYSFSEFDFMPRRRGVTKTHALVYDISDRENPQLAKDYNLNGNYFESRMIDNYVYFIANEYVYYYGGFVDVPVIMEASRKIIAPDVYYFDNPEDSYNFHTVASFDIFSDSDDINAKSFMMGYSNNLYVSKNNIYITYQKNLPYTYYQTHNEERFYKVVVPLLPISAQNKIDNIKNNEQISSYEKWGKISAVLEEMYNGMEESDKEALVNRINEAIEEYEINIEIERSKTIVHKIGIDNGEIEYKTRGEVPGYLLNQFSMDESGDYFRAATTTSFWSRSKGSVQYNNVFVLDDELDIVGKIEKIAPDERIYSTRFIGNRLYMVTFQRVDPLFVIDLSSPTNPVILGELKIPGFSDYLHPYDENHIIGIGKETSSNEWGGVSIKGVKIALFDVSDVQNPKQIGSYEIGSSGTDSEALRDHKAFLFDRKKNILVIPIREIKEKEYYDSVLGYYRQKVWQGAYAFGITPQDGIELKGKITHLDGSEDERYYWNSPSAVRRSLYMDDVLYTVSATAIKMNDLGNIDDELNKVKLPYEEEKYYGYGWY